MANAKTRRVINQQINGSDIQLWAVCAEKRKTMEGIIILTVSRFEDPSLRNQHSVRYSFRQVDVSLSFVIA